MSIEDIDREEFDVFLDEMEELLEILEEDILKLEKESGNPSLLAEIFRAAHTIKGSAAVMGFTRLSELAHSMETVFDGVRSGTTEVSVNLIDTFLHCTDTLKTIKVEISDHNEVRSDTRHHLEALEALLEQKKGKAEKKVVRERREKVKKKAASEEPKSPDQPTPPRAAGHENYCIKIDISKDCQMPFVRAFQVLTFLSEIGEIVTSSPSINEIESETKAFPLQIVLSTATGKEKTEEVLELISDIVLIELDRGDTLEAGIADADASVSETIEPEPTEAPRDIIVTEPSLPERPEPGRIDSDLVPAETEKAVPAPVTPAAEKPPREDKKTISRSVRVNVERVDAIMDLVGELVINRTRLTQLSRNLETDYELDDISEHFGETSDNIESITSQLQEHIMKARLLPIESVFNKFPRMVRDLSKKFGKKIELIIKGEKTELDRSVLEQLGDPLMHVIRNSIDHGIETAEERERTSKPTTGKIQISASHIEDHILITIEDDGKGIDTLKVLNHAKETNVMSPEVLAGFKDNDVLNLVFAPGFSTKETVSELSGRGVGMDVLRTNIEKLNGTVMLESKPGEGTKVIIKLPLTLAIIKSLLVTVRRRIFAVPLISVIQTLRIEERELQAVKGKETILFRDSVLPLLRLEKEFCLKRDNDDRERDKIFIVVVSWSGRRVGIVVDSLIGDQDIVIRPLGEYVGKVPGISGAAILGDGNISLIIDVEGVVRKKLEEIAALSQSPGSNYG